MKTKFIISVFILATCMASAAEAKVKQKPKFDDEVKTGEITSFTCEAKFGVLAKSLAALPVVKTLPGDDTARGAY